MVSLAFMSGFAHMDNTQNTWQPVQESEDRVVEGQVQHPNPIVLLFQGKDPYKKAMDYIAFAKPRQANIECGNVDRQFAVKVTMSREKA